MKHLLLSITLSIVTIPLLACHTVALTPKTTLVIEKGDITQCQAKIIVNAANDQLAGGAGVCGAIFNAAGWDALQKSCDEYPTVNGVRCPTGQARITPSFNLASKGIQHIIHAAGPDCRIIKEKNEQDSLLIQTYQTSLALADSVQAPSIAFPFISSAIFAFPRERAAQLAVHTIQRYAQEHADATNLRSIVCVLFSQADYDLFVKTVTQ